MASIASELPPLIIIAGATATGKTRLAIDLAQEIPGAEIISADSRQVYRGMDIATAKPTPDELAQAPHHGLDLVDPDEAFTAADYVKATRSFLADIAARAGVALLVGGTGLYVRAIGHGLALDASDADSSVRADLERRLAAEGLETLVADLRARDAAGAEGIDLRNPRRVIRALERTIVTGTAAPPAPLGYPAPSTWLGLRRDPAEHRRAIEERIDGHFDDGLLEEAAGLRAEYPEDLSAFSAMGYREAFDVIAGRSDVAEAKASDARRTWAYARRQRTWFRSEPGIEWIDVGEGTSAVARSRLAPFLEATGRDVYAGER